jgi:hypothetical protein
MLTTAITIIISLPLVFTTTRSIRKYKKIPAGGLGYVREFDDTYQFSVRPINHNTLTVHL